MLVVLHWKHEFTNSTQMKVSITYTLELRVKKSGIMHWFQWKLYAANIICIQVYMSGLNNHNKGKKKKHAVLLEFGGWVHYKLLGRVSFPWYYFIFLQSNILLEFLEFSSRILM